MNEFNIADILDKIIKGKGYNVCILGEEQSGKSFLLEKFKTENFIDVVEDFNMKLNIFDKNKSYDRKITKKIFLDNDLLINNFNNIFDGKYIYLENIFYTFNSPDLEMYIETMAKELLINDNKKLDLEKIIKSEELVKKTLDKTIMINTATIVKNKKERKEVIRISELFYHNGDLRENILYEFDEKIMGLRKVKPLSFRLKNRLIADKLELF